MLKKTSSPFVGNATAKSIQNDVANADGLAISDITLIEGESRDWQTPNLIHGIRTAKNIGFVTAGMTGRCGRELAEVADYYLRVPSESTLPYPVLPVRSGQLNHSQPLACVVHISGPTDMLG